MERRDAREGAHLQLRDPRVSHSSVLQLPLIEGRLSLLDLLEGRLVPTGLQLGALIVVALVGSEGVDVCQVSLLPLHLPHRLQRIVHRAQVLEGHADHLLPHSLLGTLLASPLQIGHLFPHTLLLRPPLMVRPEVDGVRRQTARLRRREGWQHAKRSPSTQVK